jgi:hypothetical protein
MNLWDSVHRGLEKASQEAARMARTQRLRAIIDGLTRHINTQHTILIGKTMELYTSGQLTQSELLPICQTLAELQQQIQQAQNELKQLQANPPPPQPQLQGPGTAPQPGATMLYPSPGETVATGIYPPPSDYQPYVDAGPITAPPPPPGVESLMVSEMERVIAPPPPPPSGMAPVQPPAPAPAQVGVASPRYCPVCQAELNPSYAFCHNCGTLVQSNLSSQTATMRAGAEMAFAAEGQETARATPQAAAETSEQETIRASQSSAPPGQQANVAPPPATPAREENEGV